MSLQADVIALDEELPPLKRLATFIRRGRTKREWSQQSLAEFVGVSRDVIKRLEAGDGDARVSVVFRVLGVLACTDRDILRILYGQIGANKSRRKHV